MLVLAATLSACTPHAVEAKAMPSNDPVEALLSESLAGRTRADSPTLPQAIRAGRACLPSLLAAMRPAPPYHRYYLLAEAIREIDPAAFAALDAGEQLRVYVEAMRHARTLDDWGYPMREDFGARGRWLLERGAAAVPLLAALLDDRRPATLLGSQESTLARMYQNRVCDYALYFLLALRGERPDYPKDPAARDRMIDQLERTLAERE
jgi:hypothetical protein